MNVRQDLLTDEKYGRMLLREHLEPSLAVGFIYSLVLEDTSRSAPKDIPEILKLFSLSGMPNFVLLISVEGCAQVDSHKIGRAGTGVESQEQIIFRKTSYEHIIKRPVEQIIQSVFHAAGCENVAYSIPNTDRIIMLVRQDVSAGVEVGREELRRLGREIVLKAREQLDEELTVTISTHCAKRSEFPGAYTACRDAYTRLVSDPEHAVRYAEESEYAAGPKLGKDVTKQYRAKLTGAISGFDEDYLHMIVDEIVDDMLNRKFSGSRVKLQVNHLIAFLIDYYSNLLVDWQQIESAGICASYITLDANYASTIKRTLFKFAQKVAEDLHVAYQSRESKFRRHMDQIFEGQYADSTFSLSSAAEAMNYNNSYFGKLFKKVYHTQFNSYLAEYRVARSKRLLADTAMPVYQISEHVGFNNHTYYCTMFKTITGQTPQQYRSEQKALQEQELSQ